MNERIKLLAEQAEIVFGFDKNNDPTVVCAPMDIEKFADLIITECLGQCFTESDANRIAKHFGIVFEDEE